MILVVFALILFGIGLGLSVSGLVSLENHVAPMQVNYQTVLLLYF